MIFLIFFTSLVVIAISLYIFYSRPVNKIVRLGDLGFYFGEPQLKGTYRERQIERLKRIRHNGELPPVYPNGWFCIAESDEVKEKQIRPIVVFGEQLSLVRSETGNVFLIDSYCPHLGANFNVGGKVVNDNCVQCPFHGWVFSAESGKCVKIPYDSGLIPEQAKPGEDGSQGLDSHYCPCPHRNERSTHKEYEKYDIKQVHKESLKKSLVNKWKKIQKSPKKWKKSSNKKV